MLKKITIQQLEIGMYVEAIIDQSGVKRLNRKGVVASQDALNSLRNAGVQSLIVDTSRQMKVEPEETGSIDTTETEKKKVALNTSSHLDYQSQCSKAYQIYCQAKSVLERAVHNLGKGEVIDIESFIALSDNFIDSIFEDQDALLLASMIREKDEYLLEHSINVALLMAAFARYLELPRETIEKLTLGAFLHDIGKIKVDDEVLNKPGSLTTSEFALMKDHVTFGLAAVDENPKVNEVARQVIAQHHEKLDGSGYPLGLSGDQISQFGRMASIVDVYDAITSERCYKSGRLSSDAFKFMLQSIDTQFDADLVNKFIKCLGVYPVGSLVELTRNRLAVVIRSNSEAPLRPVVKAFYNLRQKHYIEPVDIDLGRSLERDEIKRSLRVQDVDLDIPRFFKEFII